MEDNDIAWEFWFTVRKAATILERQVDAVTTTNLGLTLGQFMILSVIDAHPGTLNQSAIADHLGLTKGTVSRLIENGVAGGWIVVAPDPRSRRSRLVALTPVGTELVRRGDEVLESAPLGALPSRNPDVARSTIALLEEFIAAAGGRRSADRPRLPPPRGGSPES